VGFRQGLWETEVNSWEQALIAPQATLHQALETLDRVGCKVLLVTSPDRHLLGTLSDGDIRRALLKGNDLSSSVEAAMNREPHCATSGDSGASILATMRKAALHQIPIVSADNVVLGLKVIDDFLTAERRENWLVIMAGGLGSRLRELTQSTPKPMLPVGPRPLLETIVLSCASQGFSHIYLAVNYLGHQIEDHFGNGEEFGVNIQYLREDKRMGTAGALSLLPERPTLPIVVTNADVLTKQNFCAMLDAHEAHGAAVTVGVREYDMQVPFGVIRESGGRVIEIEEKPIQNYTISAGINVLSPEILDLIPSDAFFDMPTLFAAAIAEGRHVRTFSVDSYWLDVGQPHEYERANADFANVFS